jgi:hypothetical protein
MGDIRDLLDSYGEISFQEVKMSILTSLTEQLRKVS